MYLSIYTLGRRFAQHDSSLTFRIPIIAPPPPQLPTFTAKTLLFKTKPTSTIFTHIWDNDQCFTSWQLHPLLGNGQNPCTKIYTGINHWNSRFLNCKDTDHFTIALQSVTPSFIPWSWFRNTIPRNLTGTQFYFLGLYFFFSFSSFYLLLFQPIGSPSLQAWIQGWSF